MEGVNISVRRKGRSLSVNVNQDSHWRKMGRVAKKVRRYFFRDFR